MFKYGWQAIKKFDLTDLYGVDDKIIKLVQPIGVDNSSNHSFAVYNNWIFDGNLTHAIPLSVQGITVCIGSEYKVIKVAYLLSRRSQKPGLSLNKQEDKTKEKRKNASPPISS